MSGLRQTLKILAWTTVTAISLVVILAVAVFLRPTLVLNERVLSSPLAQSFLPSGFLLGWEDLKIDVENLALLHRKVQVHAQGLCLRSASPMIRACFEEIRLGGTLLWNEGQLHIEEVGPLIFHEGEFQWTVTESLSETETSNDQPPSPFILDPVPQILDQVYALKNQILRLEAFRGPFEISIPKVHLVFPGLSIRGSVESPHYATVEELRTNWLVLDLVADFQGLPLENAKGELKISPIEKGDTWAILNAYARFQNAPEGEVHLVFQKTESGHRIEAPVNMNVTTGDQPLQIRSWPIIEISEDSAQVSVEGSLRHVPGPAPVIDPVHCRVDASALLSKSKMTDVEGQCSAKTRIVATPEWMNRIPNDCRKHLPEKLGVQTEFSFPATDWFGEVSPRRTSYINATIDPVQGPILGLQGGASVAGELQELISLDLKNIEPRLELSAQVNSLQKAKECLAGFGMIIPAPFHLLDGKIQVEVGGLLERTEQYLQVPLRARVSLRESNQSVQLAAQGRLNWPYEAKTRPRLDLNILVREFFAVLPPLDPIRGLPSITPDPRFTTNQAAPTRAPSDTSEAEPETGLAFHFNVRTTRNSAIRLFYPHAEPYIPGQIHFQISSDDPFYGTVTIEDFVFEYLRRQTTIERVELNFPKKEEEVATVNGRLSVRQTNYTVFIDIVGPIDQPNIVLSSDPYLPKDDIVSVLLFDRTSDEIAGGDREDVGSLQSAIADRAIGLFGIWAFASTPIQSISYNPSQKTYAANVRLSNNTSVNIGTDWDRVRSVELRRRIARNWVVLTEVDPADDQEPGSSRLMLQWEKRY